jgi:hypothetical protein
MTSGGASTPTQRTPNLWKEAYNALSEDEKGKERLRKLNDILKRELGTPNIKMRSEDGYKRLQTSDKVNKICTNMLRIEELVAAGANVGGPYVAIPAAALFLAFSVWKWLHDT